MPVCSSVPPASGFVSAMTTYMDCQAQILGASGWQALATPGSSLSIVLTGFLTIFIAIIGYNLLLGEGPSLRSGTLAFVKIGAVFALATSWPAYRTLVYDLMIDGPSQLVAEIGPSAGVVGADGTLLQRLDLTDQGLTQLAVLGTGDVSLVQAKLPPPPFAGFDAFALGGSRILFLLTAIAGLGAVRMIIGLLLAIGPFFIAFLLFDNTRSLFEGWVRVLAGSALASLGVAIALGLELALVEPWLSDVLARRMSGQALPQVAAELFVIAALFTIVVIAVLFASARVAGAFRLASILRQLSPQRLLSVPEGQVARERLLSPSNVEIGRSRAAALSTVVMGMNRRELIQSDFAETSFAPQRNLGLASGLAPAAGRVTTPIGRSFRRQTQSRVSASANRRDSGA